MTNEENVKNCHFKGFNYDDVNFFVEPWKSFQSKRKRN